MREYHNHVTIKTWNRKLLTYDLGFGYGGIYTKNNSKFTIFIPRERNIFWGIRAYLRFKHDIKTNI
jgi:hypothetical protein